MDDQGFYLLLFVIWGVVAFAAGVQSGKDEK